MLYEQFFGRYDFTFIGNTLNPEENGFLSPTYILTSSSANLNLNPGDRVERAYLYWAGSGTGDFNIKLNGVDIIPQRSFSTTQASADNHPFFSAFYDITTMVQSIGNATYTVSDFDLNDLVSTYNQNGTNFAGWAILIVYENNALPQNQISIYDGLQNVPDQLEINLTNLYVLDNQDSKVGFIAWEGDRLLPSSSEYYERFTINNRYTLSNTINPPNNQFNGTNSVTGATNLYNMDLDIYLIDPYINIGDTSVNFKLESNQDFIMINTVAIKLNNQLPDATVSIDNYTLKCDIRELPIEYTVYNINSTDPLPAGTQIGIYANGELIATNQTPTVLGIGESVNLSQVVTIPSSIPIDFTLSIIADPDGLVTELIETNNADIEEISLWVLPVFNQPQDLISCNLGSTAAYFDFSSYDQSIKTDTAHLITFHESLTDAEFNQNPILNTFNYYSATTPHQIFVRIENEHGCYSLTSFFLRTRNCAPIIYNAVSVNGDDMNDTFHIEGLYNIFLNFDLYIYNRWGREIWKGNNNTPEWDGYIKDGVGSNQAPDGTYFYILHLNDPDYPKPLNGYLYLNH
ncbi:gliding motility-associated C-terminal domain-containing protein [Flavobacterium enshiense]|uniref:T9SS type B sorting domain-containing protein n=1 Tax=Flavobacterium enshiense TaxID=1341165 RepID=UPI001FCAD23F|nr:gliding motility-associated C-terminal domain-containing protein [Flavobacterium enshiense]UOK41239.1 gliding motility-associated C-terminal domain-containing protein [Flavobacterium enshiense]